MRLVAFVLLTLAAFAVGVPGLDRAGVAILGAAFAALALPRAPLLARRRSRGAEVEEPLGAGVFDVRGPEYDGAEELEAISRGELSDLAERVKRYTGAG